MFPYLPQAIRDELTQLAQRYGEPLVRTVDLDTSNQFDPLNKSDRYGEVCMVIRRPNGHLLTMKKIHYPPKAYRLLTGGINHGESILAALQREVYEETGLQAEVECFLAAVAYRTTSTGEVPCFYTFAFLLNEVGGMLGSIDEDEQVEAFQEILPAQLPALADYLEHLKIHDSAETASNWGEWGRFRAVIHRLVSQMLPP